MLQRLALADVIAARNRIEGIAVRTPLKPSESLSARLGGPVLLKIETMQPTGAFKVRGAAARLLELSPAERGYGVVTASTGNHGRGVAYVARHLGMRAVVCLSTLVPSNKVAALRRLGAEVDVGGANQDEAFDRAHEHARTAGLTMVSPFDDAHVIAGQGTIGLEIIEALPAVASVIVPVSGGGLASGVALALKSVRPDIRVIGVSSDRGPAMLRSLEAGRPILVPEEESLADSLGGGIGLDNRYTFSMVRDLVDEMLTVSDHEVAAAMRHAYLVERLVLEGAGASALALLLRDAPAVPPPTVALLTGDNVDPVRHRQIVCGDGCRATEEIHRACAQQ